MVIKLQRNEIAEIQWHPMAGIFCINFTEAISYAYSHIYYRRIDEVPHNMGFHLKGKI